MRLESAGAVLFFFGLEDVGRALVAGKQARAIFGGEEFFQSIDAGHDHDQVVLSERENRVEQIVARAAIAQMGFQTVSKKAQKVAASNQQVFAMLPRHVMVSGHRFRDECVFRFLRREAGCCRA